MYFFLNKIQRPTCVRAIFNMKSCLSWNFGVDQPCPILCLCVLCRSSVLKKSNRTGALIFSRFRGIVSAHLTAAKSFLAFSRHEMLLAPIIGNLEVT